MNSKPKVLFISGRESSYIRNQVLLQALHNNFEVSNFTPHSGGILLRTFLSLMHFIARNPNYDICLVGFYSQLLAVALSLLQRKPLIVDAYISTFDTLCYDRRWFQPHSPPGRLAYWLDQRSCLDATRLLTDTESHAHYFSQTFNIPLNKFTPVYVGCDEAVFYPRTEILPVSNPYEIFSYSSFLPLHGIEVVLRAAELLRHDKRFRFVLGGDGICRREMYQLANALHLENVDFIGWIPLGKLPDYIARASICLGGHFSTIPKAGRVISTKTFQFIAMRKPTIVGDNEASREVFISGEHVYAVQPGNPQSLAEAICLLMDNWELQQRVADGGYNIFGQRFATSVITQKLSQIIKEIKCEYVS